MMKKHPFIAITALTISSALFIVSCLKKASTPALAVTNYTLDQLFAELRYTPQLLKVWAGRDTVVLGADSTELHFYTNSFRDAAGNVLTNEWIYVNLTEYYTGGDMISNRLTTVAGDSLLQSGGEINLTATTTTFQTVYVYPYSIGFKQKAASTQPMQLYYGYTGSDSNVYWHQGNVSNNGANANGTVADTATDTSMAHVYYYYTFDTCMSVGFTNCDKFYDYPADSVTNITISVPDTSINSWNTSIFLYFPNIRSNIDMIYNKSTHSFSPYNDGWGDEVPIGANYECIAIGTKGGNYYIYQISGTITKNMNITASMTATTIANIKTQLAGL